jgi:AmpD protein
VAKRADHGARRPQRPPPGRHAGTSIRIDAAGIASSGRLVLSPNCDARPPGVEITLLVIHNISLPPGEFGGDGVLGLFTNTLDHGAHPAFEGLRGLRVSAHFFLRRTGELIQLVPCDLRAWHAGESVWRGRSRCNDFSIGVELEGTDTLPYADIQYDRLARLATALARRYPIADIVGHSEIAPTRKTDPGPAFDWPRLRVLVDGARRR